MLTLFAPIPKNLKECYDVFLQYGYLKEATYQLLCHFFRSFLYLPQFSR